MSSNRSATLALASLGAAIGAIAANGPKARRKFFSPERTIASLLGASAGFALGMVGEAVQEPTTASLRGLPLLDNDPTPLKRRRIELVRSDAPPVAALSPAGMQLHQTYAKPQPLNSPLLS